MEGENAAAGDARTEYAAAESTRLRLRVTGAPRSSYDNATNTAARVVAMMMCDDPFVIACGPYRKVFSSRTSFLAQRGAERSIGKPEVESHY